MTSPLKALNRQQLAHNLRARMMDGSLLIVAAGALIMAVVASGGP